MAEIFGIVSAAIGVADVAISKLTNLAERLEKSKGLSSKFVQLQYNVQLVRDGLEHISSLLEENGDSLTATSRKHINAAVTRVERQIAIIPTRMVKLENLLPRSTARITRADKISKLIEDLLADTAASIATLQPHATTMHVLSSPLLARFSHPALPQSAAMDAFAPSFKLPAYPRHAVVDFHLSATEGQSLTPEAELLRAVLALACRPNHEDVQAGHSSASSSGSASGSATPRFTEPVTSIFGTGGLGKTVALTCLAHQPRLREIFRDGIYFMRCGHGASAGSLIASLARIVEETGASALANSVKQEASVEAAAARTAARFRGRDALILADDLWPHDNAPHGYVDALRNMVADTRATDAAGTAHGCVLVLSTRDGVLARRATASPISIAPRDAEGTVSRRIMLARANVCCAAVHCPPLDFAPFCPTLRDILCRCGGVPLKLALAGGALCSLREGVDSWDEAISRYAQRLSRNSRSLWARVECDNDYPHSLETVVRTSVALAAGFAQNDPAGPLDEPQYSDIDVHALFVRLCVVGEQQRVCNGVLRLLLPELVRDGDDSALICFRRRLIQLNLLVSEAAEDGTTRVGLHDHVIAFCANEARRMEIFSDIHRNFLNGRLAHEVDTESPFRWMNQRSAVLNLSNFYAFETLDAPEPDLPPFTDKIRPWWTLGDSDTDLFIVNDLAYLLVCAGQQEELKNLLWEQRWFSRRTYGPGSGALRSDIMFAVAKPEAYPGSNLHRHFVVLSSGNVNVEMVFPEYIDLVASIVIVASKAEQHMLKNIESRAGS